MKKSDTFFKNGLLNANRQVLIKAIVNALIKVKLQPSKLTDDQIIEIYETTHEMQEINEQVSGRETILSWFFSWPRKLIHTISSKTSSREGKTMRMKK